MSKKFIVGLGNPGKKYENTRHNVGFDFIDFLSMAWMAELDQKSHLSVWGRAKDEDLSVFLIQPQSFMNDSGKSLLEWKRREGLSAQSMLVVFDDMDLSPGRVRFRASGSGGSHNGMASIIECLGTQEFARLRLGIGRPQDPALWANYVLGRSLEEENEAYAAAMENGKIAVDMWLKGARPDDIMTKVNGKNT